MNQSQLNTYNDICLRLNKFFGKHPSDIELKYRYTVLTKAGDLEFFTGVFDDEATCDKWYSRYGKWHEDNGHTLIKMPVSDKLLSFASHQNDLKIIES